MVQQVSDFKLELMKTILDYPKGGSNHRDRRRFGSIRAAAKKLGTSGIYRYSI